MAVVAQPNVCVIYCTIQVTWLKGYVKPVFIPHSTGRNELEIRES